MVSDQLEHAASHGLHPRSHVGRDAAAWALSIPLTSLKQRVVSALGRPLYAG